MRFVPAAALQCMPRMPHAVEDIMCCACSALRSAIDNGTPPLAGKRTAIRACAHARTPRSCDERAAPLAHCPLLPIAGYWSSSHVPLACHVRHPAQQRSTAASIAQASNSPGPAEDSPAIALSGPQATASATNTCPRHCIHLRRPSRPVLAGRLARLAARWLNQNTSGPGIHADPMRGSSPCPRSEATLQRRGTHRMPRM